MLPAIILGAEKAVQEYNKTLKKPNSLDIDPDYLKYSKLDKIIRRMNLNRTNGLLIGPLYSKLIVEAIEKAGYKPREDVALALDIASTEMYEISKTKPRKIKDNYLIEIEVNEQTKELLKSLKQVEQIKLYKRTHTWEQIYKMS